jgi:hypothetical protein
LLSLGTVLVEELEQLGSGVAVQGMRELSDGGRNLQTLMKDDLLALEANIFGPFDETRKITFMLDILA